MFTTYQGPTLTLTVRGEIVVKTRVLTLYSIAITKLCEERPNRPGLYIRSALYPMTSLMFTKILTTTPSILNIQGRYVASLNTFELQ